MSIETKSQNAESINSQNAIQNGDQMQNTTNNNNKINQNNTNNIDTKLSLLMKSLTEFYKNGEYINQIKNIVDQNSVISLRILDWFITNYSKKHRTIINTSNQAIDVYQNYKLQLKSFSKKQLSKRFDRYVR